MTYLDRLRTYLKVQGSRVSELAVKIDMTENQLLSYLVDGQVPSEELDSRICDALNVPNGSFFDAKADEFVLARTHSDSSSKLYFRMLLESLSTMSALLPLAIAIAFFLVFGGSIKGSEIAPTGFIFLACGVGFLVFALCFAGYRYSLSMLFKKTDVTFELHYTRMVFTSKGSSESIDLFDLAGRLEETSDSFVVTPDGKRAMCIPKEGLTQAQLTALRDILKEALGAYRCCVKPSRLNGFGDEIEAANSALSYRNFLGWQSMGISLSFIVLALGLAFGLFAPLIGELGIAVGGLCCIALGLASVAVWIVFAFKLRFRVSIPSWLSLVLGIALAVAGIVLATLFF